MIRKAWAYIADAWVIWLLTIVMYAVMTRALCLWMDGSMSFGKMLLFAFPACAFFQWGVAAAFRCHRIHFGMNDEKLEKFVDQIMRHGRGDDCGKGQDGDKPGSNG